MILSPLGRRCEKAHVYTWLLHYYLEGITTFNTYSEEVKLFKRRNIRLKTLHNLKIG